MHNVESLQQLSAQIAKSIAQKLALEKDSGRITDGCTVKVAGLIDGDETRSIDLVSRNDTQGPYVFTHDVQGNLWPFKSRTIKGSD